VKILLTLLFALPLAAEGAHVFPFAPTTATPTEVHYLSSCHARAHSVTRDGRAITVTALDPQCPQVLPIPLVERVKLPALPMGEYDVTIGMQGDPNPFDSTTFVVRNGGPLPFELHPSAMFPNAETPVHMSGVTCEESNCSDVTIRVAGQAVSSVTVADDGAIWFVPPAHEEGLLDVTVQKGDVITTSPGALYYYTDEDLSVQEPILFPIIESTDGAFGSKWRSEATISNPSPWEVDADYTMHCVGPCVGPCDPPIEPKSFQQFHACYPRGTVFYAPRSEASHLAMSLRIRDISRDDEGYGTEIPVVREHDFVHGAEIRLLDVPLDPRYRVKVRLYAVEPGLAPSLSGFVRIQRDSGLLQLPFSLTKFQSYFSNEPYYAEVDLPQGAIGERVNLEIVMPLDATAWAFASVTNNETQQVTIVAPY
jgi:hypothetical protein